ncbi:MAG: hypothetical protein H6502_05410 [Candidatus Woesearchaeota archaeon]|nr:MAG: hypothetical protein H6502_05410 [Candidatus Woesearchaeota archaeon]
MADRKQVLFFVFALCLGVGMILSLSSCTPSPEIISGEENTTIVGSFSSIVINKDIEIRHSYNNQQEIVRTYFSVKTPDVLQKVYHVGFGMPLPFGNDGLSELFFYEPNFGPGAAQEYWLYKKTDTFDEVILLNRSNMKTCNCSQGDDAPGCVYKQLNTTLLRNSTGFREYSVTVSWSDYFTGKDACIGHSYRSRVFEIDGTEGKFFLVHAYEEAFVADSLFYLKRNYPLVFETYAAEAEKLAEQAK